MASVSSSAASAAASAASSASSAAAGSTWLLAVRGERRALASSTRFRLQWNAMAGLVASASSRMRAQHGNSHPTSDHKSSEKSDYKLDGKSDDKSNETLGKKLGEKLSEKPRIGHATSSRVRGAGVGDAFRVGDGVGVVRVGRRVMDGGDGSSERKYPDGVQKKPFPKKDEAFSEGSQQRQGVKKGKTSFDSRVQGKKWERRGVVVDPQVAFKKPLRKDLQVAIIGGGMSGLACAVTLSEHGIKSTVFDTGKHGLGGRMATRHVAIQGQNENLIFDHAAQFFTVSDSRFANIVADWKKKNLIREWDGCFGIFQAPEKSFVQKNFGQKYVAVNGMRLLCDSIVASNPLITIQRPFWVSDMNAKNESWSLFENGKYFGNFDIVVIAHNGKCANRLLSGAGVPSILCQMKSLELSSIWVLMAAFEKNLPTPNVQNFPVGGILEGAFVEGIPSLTFMANNTLKLKNNSQVKIPYLNNQPHCWTFLSSAQYGKENKVPQENIPLSKAEKVKKDMLRGVELALGLKEGELPEPIFHKVQLWGAGLPLNSPKIDFIFDSVGRCGMCGDFLKSSNIESAYISGMELANHISRFRENGTQNVESFSVGLDTPFERVDGHDIGCFDNEPLVTPEPASVV